MAGCLVGLMAVRMDVTRAHPMVLRMAGCLADCLAERMVVLMAQCLVEMMGQMMDCLKVDYLEVPTAVLMVH